ncbi:hypothetical protein BGZ54_005533, partial [Gamsiella multidivaricata]
MTDNILSLYCLVHGESISIAFPSKASSTDTVGDLKSLNVNGDQAPAFRDVAAKDLILWRASIPDGSETTIDALDDKTELNNPRTRLSKLLPESPDDNTYIIVQRPLPVQTSIAVPVP